MIGWLKCRHGLVDGAIVHQAAALQRVIGVCCCVQYTRQNSDRAVQKSTFKVLILLATA